MIKTIASLKFQRIWGEGMHQFAIGFTDNTEGECNAKSMTPPYKVGDDVEVTIAGQSPKGTTKFKIQALKEGQGAPRGGHRSTAPAQPPAGRTPLPPQPPEGSPAVHGATVGMAVKAALDLHTCRISDLGTMRVALEDPIFWKRVYTTASDIIRTSRALEAGELVPSCKLRNASPDPKTDTHEDVPF